MSYADRITHAILDDARSSRDWSGRRLISELYKGKVIAEPPLHLGRSQVLLGHTELNYTKQNAVIESMPYIKEEMGSVRSNPPAILIMGDRGTGKSILESVLARDHGINNYGMKLFEIDSSRTPESWLGRYAVTDERIPIQGGMSRVRAQGLTSYFSMFGLRPRGYTCTEYKALFNAGYREEGVDRHIQLTLADIKNLKYFDEAEAVQVFADIIEAEDSRPAKALIRGILNNDDIKTFRDIFIMASEGTLGTRQFEHEYDYEVDPIKPGVFLGYLQNALDTKIITNDAQPDIVDELTKKDIVAYRHRLRSSAKDSKIVKQINLYPKTYLTHILNDRAMAISGDRNERAKARLRGRGIIIEIREAHSFMPSTGDSYTSKIGENLVSMDRKTGIIPIMDVQNVGNLSEEVSHQVDYVFFTQPNIQENAEYLTDMGINEKKVERWKRLMVKGDVSNPKTYNSLGFPVSTMGMLRVATKTVRFFYSTCSLSAFKIT